MIRNGRLPKTGHGLVSVLILVATAAAGETAPVAGQPNIVIILADDMGYSDASCYGNTAYKTPHIDALADQGMRFTDFHSSGPVCSPTRAGLLTGRYQQRAGVPGVIYAGFNQNRHHGLHPREVTFAELLRETGYTCAVFGKWHLGYNKQFSPIHHGFDRFRGYVSGNIDYISHFDRVGVQDWWDGLEVDPEEGYSTHLITKHAVQFIEKNKDRPFCLYIAHESPHSPYQGPGDPPVRGPLKQMPEGKGHIPRAYRQMIQEMDRGIGEVVATIDRLDLARRTLVFFFSDNGGNPNGSNTPLRGFKSQLWEGGHRVPAIARWTGRIEPNSICDEPCISIDIMPTMLDLTGTQPPPGHQLDGTSLIPVLLENHGLGDRALFWDYRNHQAMRQGPWKLIVTKHGVESVGLYNLADDLSEKHNLAKQHPQRSHAMLAAIAAWQEDVTTPPEPQAVNHGTGHEGP